MRSECLERIPYAILRHKNERNTRATLIADDLKDLKELYGLMLTFCATLIYRTGEPMRDSMKRMAPILVIMVAVSLVPVSADILYNGYIYVNERILVGPYIIYLKEVSESGSLAILLVMKDNAVLYPTGQKLPFSYAGQEIKVEDIVVNVQEVFSTGARISVSGPSKYKIGRAGIVLDIRVHTTPAMIIPGEEFSLNIDVSNEGSQRAFNVSTTLALPDMTPALFSTLQSNTTYFDFLDASSTRLASFKMKTDGKTPSGSYTILLSMTYFDGSSAKPQTVYKKFSLIVEGQPRVSVAKVSTNPSKVHPGNKAVLLTVSFENQGTDDARFLEATLVCEDPFSLASSYSQTFSAGILKSGMSVPALFAIDVSSDASSGRHDLFLDLTYKDSFENSYSERQVVELTIPETPHLIVINVIVGKAVEGESFSVHIFLKNTGKDKAESVIVEAQEKSEQPFEYDIKSDLVGDIEPEGTGEAVLVLNAQKGASAKMHLISLKIRASGDKKEGDYGLYLFDSSFEVRVGKGVPRNTILYAAGAFFIVVILAGLFFLARKKG